MYRMDFCFVGRDRIWTCASNTLLLGDLAMYLVESGTGIIIAKPTVGYTLTSYPVVVFKLYYATNIWHNSQRGIDEE